MPVRTEQGMRLFMSNHGLRVMPSNAHGANNCLIDCVLLSLQHEGLAKTVMTVADRADVCRRTRLHLVSMHGMSQDGYLAHHEALSHVFNYLRREEPQCFENPEHMPRVALTCTVVDRFTSRAELVPSEPVLVNAYGAEEPVHVLIQLYACTHLDGCGWHYEWIRSAAPA